MTDAVITSRPRYTKENGNYELELTYDDKMGRWYAEMTTFFPEGHEYAGYTKFVADAWAETPLEAIERCLYEKDY